MNNSQFRRLLLDTPRRSSNQSPNGENSTPRRNATTLGSKMHSSIPMTPRSVSSIDFARQLAERSHQPPPHKKFKSSAAPKGTKLAAGYHDRVKVRQETEEDEDEDEKAQRVKALEEMVKLGQIDQGTFEKLRGEIGVGGDVKSTHLVKGLDFKLLERVKRGEDVLNPVAKKYEGEELREKVDVDEALDALEQKEVAPVAREQREKHGQMAPMKGKKRTRDEIMAELKAARLATMKPPPAPESTLGSKFRKIGEKTQERRLEIDDKGREVLIITDENGNVKRKVRKVENESTASKNGLLMPDIHAKPLGIEASIPELKKPSEPEDDDVDIFDGVGDDYDPLAGIEDEDEDSSSDEEGELSIENRKKPPKDTVDEVTTKPSKSPQLQKLSQGTPAEFKLRDYFASTSTTKTTEEPSRLNPSLSDPLILAAIKKASTISTATETSSTSPPSSDKDRLKRLLEAQDRDAQDMDLGFGSSRFEDEEDMEERKVKFSVWGKNNGNDDEVQERGRQKRKRGPKKKKGDGENAAHVIGLVEERKKREGR
ncbi:MAG: hypothetical protein M1834_007321 [Cirrosporium novae-zelandiae]|nr:MAG: hypothetical protein M1834_007321 [Cirrosporium novae-zelandiae]